MMSSAQNALIFVGVDVSKDSLDIFRPDSNEVSKIENSETAIQEFCLKLQKKKRNVIVVMEATGGYETLLVNQLAKHDVQAAVANPRQVRAFARGLGIDPKTGAMDARGLARFGEVVRPKPVAMDPKAPVRVAFIRTISPIKGWPAFAALVRPFSMKAGHEFIAFGLPPRESRS